MSIFKRGTTYQLRRRVPRRYKDVEARSTIWVSLHTDSESIAKRKAEDAWRELVEAWEAKLAGRSAEAGKRYEAALELAQIRGFRYMDVKKVAQLPVEEILERIKIVENSSGEPDTVEAASLLGTATKPELTIKAALAIYWSLTEEKTLGKSEDQLRKWKNPRIKAIRNLIEVIGNKPIEMITRDDMLDFRDFWFERVRLGEVQASTANKDLIHIGDVLKTINKMKRLGLDLPLGDLSFKEGEQKTRPPFSVEWIQSKLLKKHALSGLNGEARAILLGMINTGYRPSEGASLTRNTIHLDHDVPHISIEGEDRQLKTKNARRRIPLTGVSLEAFREYPEGFPRYRNKASLSATVNKYLRAH